MEVNEQNTFYEEAKNRLDYLEVLVQPEDIGKECKIIAELMQKAGDYMDAPLLAQEYKKRAEEEFLNAHKIKYAQAEKIIAKAKSASDYDRAINLFKELGTYSDAEEKVRSITSEKRIFIKKQNILLAVRGAILVLVLVIGWMAGNYYLKQKKGNSAGNLSVEQTKESEKEITIPETEQPEKDDKKSVFAGAKPGDVITFGKAKWRVLSVQEEEVLLLGAEVDQNDVLKARAFHNEETAVTWEQSELRRWLNDEFLEETFTEEERAQILTKDLTNEGNSRYHTADQADTKDAVYLLSEKEAEEMWDELKGLKLNWLLRTSGNQESAVMYVSSDHQIRTYGTSVVDKLCVRPVICVKVME